MSEATKSRTGLLGQMFPLDHRDMTTRNFSGLLLSVVMFVAALLLMYPGPMVALWLSFVYAVAAIWFAWKRVIYTDNDAIDHESGSRSNNQALYLRLAVFVLLASSVPVFFGASNIVNRARVAEQPSLIFDDVFLWMDASILGRLFPDGQLALWLDTNEIIGPTTFPGKLMAEILQVFYFSYYLWGNALGIYLAYVYYRSVTNPKERIAGESLSVRLQWRRLQIFLVAWVSTYLVNFLLNLIFPAVSPRIHIASRYINEIDGLFFANIIRSALRSAAANSYSAFPSGHCGLSWMAYVLAERMGYTRYARACKYAAALITAATLVLRYHYFVDALFATFLVGFGVFVSGIETTESYDQTLRGEDEADLKKDIDLKDLEADA